MEEKKRSTREELLNLAKEKGIQLTNEQLEGISGGGVWEKDDDNNEDEKESDVFRCPDCDSVLTPTRKTSPKSGKPYWYCGMCDKYFV